MAVDYSYKNRFDEAIAKQQEQEINKFNHNNIILPTDELQAITSEIIPGPYPGIMAFMVDHILSIANKPQPELSILSTLIGMAASIGGNYKLPGGGRLNLYGLGISPTGSGKEKAMFACTSLASIAGADIIGMPGSGAGLEDSLSELGTKLLLNIDEVAHFIAAMNDNKQSHMASLSGNLLKLFTASRNNYITRKLANSSNNQQKICVNPCVSFLGFACPERLGEALGSALNIDDGLMGRMLVVNGREGVKPNRDKSELQLPEVLINRAKMVNSTRETVLSFTAEANEKLDDLIQEFDSSSIKSTNPFEKNLKVRSFEKCEKIAGVLAVWDFPEEPVIGLNEVLWAESFVKYSDNEIIKFTCNHLHGGRVQADASKIIKIINKFKNGELTPATQSQRELLKIPGTFPKTVILKATHLAKHDFDIAIDHLIDLGDINIGIKNLNGYDFKVIFS